MSSKEHARRSGPVRRPAGTREAQDDTAITRPAWNLHFALAAIVLVLLVVATYAPTFRGGLLMDDEINLASNRTLYTVGGLWHMWIDPNSVQQYYPLVHTMFWVERRLWGFEPAGYHVVNVLLHAASVVLLWPIARAPPSRRVARGGAVCRPSRGSRIGRLDHRAQKRASAWRSR